jgi:hypothetical protein
MRPFAATDILEKTILKNLHCEGSIHSISIVNMFQSKVKLICGIIELHLAAEWVRFLAGEARRIDSTKESTFRCFSIWI